MPRGPHSQQGNYGGIPDEIILQRNEATCLYENPEMMNYHNRNILKDERPDAPYMESDMPRNGGYDPRTGESRQGGSWSRSKLSLRNCGRRSQTEPYLPEGTFIDWQFLEKDPRSIRPDPDFQEYDRQRKFRGRYVNFYNDDDMSVPESGINPYQMQMNVRNSQRWASDRMKWFDTAKDNWTPHRVGHTLPYVHRVTQVTVDGEVINLSDAVTANKSNLTDLLTNQYKIGWRRTTDQDFKVAKYGQVRPSAKISKQKWYKNIRKGIDDRKDAAVFQDQIVPKTLVVMMQNIINSRNEKQKDTGGIPWKSSYGLKNYKTNLEAANYRGGKVGYQSVEDRADEIVRLLQNAYVHRKNAMISMPDKPNSKIGMSWIDPALVHFMELSHRKIGKQETSMILKQAAIMAGMQSGSNANNMEASVTIPLAQDVFDPTEALWKSKDFRHVDRSLVAANYTNINPIDPHSLMYQGSDGEDYKSRADQALHYSNRPPIAIGGADTLTHGHVLQDQEFSRGLQRPAQMIGQMGDKYTRRHMDETHRENINMAVDDTGADAVNDR